MYIINPVLGGSGGSGGPSGGVPVLDLENPASKVTFASINIFYKIFFFSKNFFSEKYENPSSLVWAVS